MEEKTCCFTGHRKLPYNKTIIMENLKKQIVELINQGIIYYGTGGALGFDTIAAQVILELKNIYPQIKLILVLPYKNQSNKWANTDKEIYNSIKKRCDKIVYTSIDYYKGCFFKRNKHLVDNSRYCICYLIKQTGGTAYTVKYAKSKDLKIINIATLIELK